MWIGSMLLEHGCLEPGLQRGISGREVFSLARVAHHIVHPKRRSGSGDVRADAFEAVYPDYLFLAAELAATRLVEV